MLVVLWMSTSLFGLAQTIVSTQPMNKRPVLEEFGGIYCVYCPDGHAIAAVMSATSGDELVLLRYHEGSYATPLPGDPDLRSDYGPAIMAQTGLTGYPAGALNRHVFPGYEQGNPGSTALNRGHWATAADQIQDQLSPVNLAAEATLDIGTNELEVYIEYYYTSNGPSCCDRLNVAVLQNNILGPQLGGGLGNYYEHDHVVRDFLTGQWGHLIQQTQAGAFGSLTYNVTLPTDYRDVWVDPVNIELAIFIADSEQEIFTGLRLQPNLIASQSNDAQLLSVRVPEEICGDDITPILNFRNDGSADLSNLTIQYGLDSGAAYTTSWTGTLPSLSTAEIMLPPLPLDADLAEDQLTVTLVEPNGYADPTAFNNSRQHRFRIAPNSEGLDLELMLRTDGFGYEIYWDVIDGAGNIMASGGNEVVGETLGGEQIASPSDPGAYDNNDLIIESFTLPATGCYTLRVFDDYADGLCCFYGNGFYRLREPGQTALLSGGEFGAQESRPFAVGADLVAAEQVGEAERIPLPAPNPLRPGEPLRIIWPQGAPAAFHWSLIDGQGRRLAQGDAAALPLTHDLAPGYYQLQISAAQDNHSLPFIVVR